MASVLVRADADPRIGAGHVMRCLALAQALHTRSIPVCFACALLPESLEARLRAEGIEPARIDAVRGSTEDALATSALAGELGSEWIVADGYCFGSDYQRAIVESALRLMVVDDNGGDDEYRADVILNQNLHAGAELYPKRAAHARLLLGPGYAMLRREFTRWRGWKRPVPDSARRVLVSMGGSDPDNVSLMAVEALGLLRIDGLEAVVVVGGSNPHIQELRAAAGKLGDAVRVERNVADMPELMAWADVAIAGAGSTFYELAFMGLPSVLVVVADNQVNNAGAVHESGASVSVGWFHANGPGSLSAAVDGLMRDSSLRRDMSEKERLMVDGEGSRRVASVLADWPAVWPKGKSR